MQHHAGKHEQHDRHHYRTLTVMLVLSFIAMYGLMYAMVDSRQDVFMNVNQVYMAALMTAPMAIIELLLMRHMYTNRRLNAAVLSGGLALLVVSWTSIRQQTAVTDEQFLRSMIPHHAGAILMCREAPIRDAEVSALCRQIIESQQAEINLMKATLARLSD